MKAFDPPDSHYLSAAQGWLELGDHLAANEELDLIRAELRVHPEVLLIRWEIYRREQKWEACRDIGGALVQTAPQLERSWIFHATGFYYLKQFQAAFDALAPAIEKFPKSPAVSYDLACYHCLLGRLKEARDSLWKSFELGGKDFKLRALEDPDLQALRDKTGKLEGRQP